MDGFVAPLSSQLIAANERLHELRAQAQAQRQALSACAEQASQAGDIPSGDVPDLSPARASELAAGITALPAHLGWGSVRVTAVIRRHGPQSPGWGEDADDWTTHLAGPPRGKPRETAVVRTTPTTAAQPTSPNSPPFPGWVKLYPSIGLGMLRQEMTAPGRLWLMLRYLDPEGSGRIRIVNIAQALTLKSSPLRLCGKRQMRNLLQNGEGVYWTRDKEYVWLYSAARAAYSLGVEQLTGQPVAMPLAALLEGIGSFRAHLYAAFHSGRTKATPHGTQVMPIARDTLTGLSGVGQSSQRAYEARAKVKVQANFAVGEVAREENRENRAWTQGQALFELKDYRGEQGKKGKTYLAWQLPNTYIGQHRKRPRGRQKRINRKLKDLVMKGMPGNVGGTDETQKSDTSMNSKQIVSAVEKREKIYFPNGKLAARAYGRGGRGVRQRELYWHMRRSVAHKTAGSRFVLWQQLGRGQC